ncbi:MAG: right-handed parallel beta-helix repeat-containing protein, partial [Planctomycetota bacterium]
DFGGKSIKLQSIGGAVHCIIDCENSGRGFYFHNNENKDAVVRGFTIKNGNKSSDNGGGIYCYSASPTIIDCIIMNNSAYNGGGIYCDYSAVAVINCILTDNTATRSGGGIYCNGNPDSIISNCTIVYNNATDYGGGVSCYNASPTFNNTIIWGNTAAKDGNQIYTYDGNSEVSLNNCNYPTGENDLAGEGSRTPKACIDSDPMFVDIEVKDYHLKRGSGCIDAGNNNLIPVNILTDLDGRKRVWSSKVDIGAYDGGWLLVPSIYTTIQDAVDDGNDGDVVIVSDGTYTGEGNKEISFAGRKLWVRSKNGAADCIIDCESSGRAFNSTQETQETIIDGFTIINGNVGPESGGGILCFHSSPTIKNCTIKNNYGDYGGGIGLIDSESIIINCVITENEGYRGGGILFDENSNPVMSKCSIYKNTANSGGGIACYTGSNPVIKDCMITENAADNFGGGVSCYSLSDPLIANSVIAKNSANKGGGIAGNDSSPTLTNCTIADNAASEEGGGLYFENASKPNVNNTIIWGNNADVNGKQIFTSGGTTTLNLHYCDYPKATSDVAGVGTVNANSCIEYGPRFVDAVNGDYHLQSDSPCIDKGNNAYAVEEAVSAESYMRIVDGDGNNTATIDIGAFEKQ